jgi:hypothetical protein
MLADKDGNKYQTCPTKLVLEALNQFLIFPNCVQVGETINVETIFNNRQETKKAKLDVSNMNGSVVYSQKVDGSTTSFEMEDPGFYLVQLTSGTNVRVAKLLVKK